MGTNTAIKMSSRRIAAGAIGGLIIALLVIRCPQFTFGQQPQTQQPQAKTFPSAGQAAQALYEAVRNRDDGAVEAILGAGPELTSSGDEAIDTLEREQFAEKYLQMHRLVRETDGTVVLYIGAENWPFPIPLVDRNGKWRFDPDAGAQEITARTIGENETFAFRVSKHVGTQHAGKATQPAIEGEKTDQLALEFARRLGSNSPDASQSFHGYNFKTAAEHGQGVLLVAYPANYRLSGVVTFIVLPDGSVYEKDLGPKTANLGPQIKAKPTVGWTLVR